MTEDLQFDASLGGSQELPERLTLLYFTSARAKEIDEMKQTLKAPSGVKMAFQRLPKHMRRRIMSHNAKRLPRRLREIHLSQLTKSGLPPKQKRPSRKYRRRPSNLIQEYAKRQHKYNWLETHIWHAKRFHIIQKWGYRLPERPCDKAFRACYRATAKHCCLQDISYFRCVEIGGPVDILIEHFKTLCEPNTGLTIGAKSYIQGNREGQITLFKSYQGVRHSIGTVSFHWKPKDNNSVDRILWLWIHAAYYSEVLNLFKTCFMLSAVVADKHINNTTNIYLTEIDINRFRLIGPTSLAILQSVLRTPQDSCSNSIWFKDFFSLVEPELFNKQSRYWDNLQPGSKFPSHRILCLNVQDPRYNMPKTRTKPNICQNNKTPIEIPDSAAVGPIWEKEIRKTVKLNKVSNAKFAEMKSELLVPGSDLQQPADIVPVMLIQRPGSQSRFLGYGSGWDLVVPSGWGNTFWISLVMWGARAGSLREFNSIRFESGLVPFLEPDTQAGIEEEKAIQIKHEQRYFSLPPNKRPNYTKLGIIQPFNLNWKALIQDWSPPKLNGIDSFQVLRDKSKLKAIQDFICGRVKSIDIEEINYLIPVRLQMEQRGIAKNFAQICLPKASDFLNKNMVLEPIRDDTNQLIRKEMRLNHKQLLKKLRRKRIEAKRNNKVLPKDVEVLKTYKEKMQKLWLPCINEGLRFSSTRELMGYIVSGNFSFLLAKGLGIGYITHSSLKALELNKYRSKVLVRNIGSRVYRMAQLEVIV